MKNGIFVFFLLFAATLFSLSPSWGADRYASPSGSGSTCSSGTPCTLTEAMNQAQAGDHVILQDGTYSRSGNLTVRSGTASQPITIRAQNKRQATILFNQSSANTARIVGITHSNIVLKDLVVNGNGWSWDGIWINCSSSSPCSNITIENNRITNTGGKALGAHHYASNIIYRYNELDNIDPSGGATYTGNNTPFYMGSGAPLSGSDLVSNVQIYGNIVTLQTQTTGENLMDLKENTRDFHVHHNIFQGLVSGNDGCIALKNINHIFEDNIIRDSECGSAVFADLAVFGNHIVRRNVVRDMNDTPSRSDSLIWYHQSLGQAASQFVNNTGCSIISTVIEASGGGGSATPSGLTLSGNNMSAAAGTCDTEELRIIGEIAARPTIASAEIGLVAADKIRITWVNNKFSPLASVDNAKITCTVAGVGRTVSSSIIVGQNTTEHTLASAVTAGQAVVCTAATTGLVVNSGQVGGTWISDLASSAAFTTGSGGVPSIVNNVGGSPSSATIAQSRARCYLLYGATDGSWRPIATDDTCNITVPAGSKLILVAKLRGENADPSPFNPRLRYDLDGGGYTEIPTDFSADNIKALGTGIQPGTVVAEGPLAAGDRLTSDEATNIACAFVRTASSIPNLDLSQDSEAECAWAIEFDADAAGVYSFRVYTDTGITLDSYTGGPGVGVTPTITIGRNSALY